MENEIIIKISKESEDSAVSIVTEGTLSNDFKTFYRYFDETCAGWEKSAEYNMNYIRFQKSFLYDLAKVKGYVTLNDAFRALDMTETNIGSLVGWMYKGLCNTILDIQFYPDVEDERRILVQFKVDGIIIDKINN